MNFRGFHRAYHIARTQLSTIMSYIKKGINRPLVIPAHPKPVQVFVIQNNLRTAKMGRDEYFKYLADC
jgi:hypothetical protein